MRERYPQVEINLSHLRKNVESVVSICNEKGISVTGVIKGSTGLPKVANQFFLGGCKHIASSRMEQLEDAMDFGIPIPRMLIRVPMLSEVEEVIRVADYSLNSELATVEALNLEAKKQNKVHNVILMADLGDLREGFWDKDEMVFVAKHIEKDLENIHLAGVGVNLGCYGSILATKEKLEELVFLARRIEKEIGRKLEIVSGGATSSLMRVIDNDIPLGINNLRIGEGILLAYDLEKFYGYNMDFLYQDCFKLNTEVIEVKEKPSYPVGVFAVDAFGHKPTYIDRGNRKRALLAIGKVDYSSIDELIVLEEGMEILGASSDHTIIDIENLKRDLKVGDIVTFGLNYASLCFVTNCRNVNIKYIE